MSEEPREDGCRYFPYKVLQIQLLPYTPSLGEMKWFVKGHMLYFLSVSHSSKENHDCLLYSVDVELGRDLKSPLVQTP